MKSCLGHFTHAGGFSTHWKNFSNPWKIFSIAWKIFSTLWKNPRLAATAAFVAAGVLGIVVGGSGCRSRGAGEMVLSPSSDWTVSASSAQKSHGPEMAADGEKLTEWRSSPQDEHPWWQADLGRPGMICGFSLLWGETPGVAYTISTSLDGVHWAVAYQTERGDGDWDLMTVAPMRARFVRLSVERRDHGRGTSLRELEALGLWTQPEVIANGLPCPEGRALLNGTRMDEGWVCPQENGELTVDFRRVHSVGSIRVDWGRGGWAADVVAQTSTNGTRWRRMGRGRSGGGFVSIMARKCQEARFVRLTFRGGSGPVPEEKPAEEPAEDVEKAAPSEVESPETLAPESAAELRGFEVTGLTFRGAEGTVSPWSKLEAAAEQAAPGIYPMVLRGEQVYWTAAGASGAMLSEEGAFAGGGDWPALWPMVVTDSKIHTPAQANGGENGAERTWRLGEHGAGPLPEMRWTFADGLSMRIRAMERPDGKGAWEWLELENTSERAREGWLCLVLHPVAIPPPWANGGLTPVYRVRFPAATDDNMPQGLEVNGEKMYAAQAEVGALAIGAAPFGADGVVSAYLANGQWPDAPSAKSDEGLASGLYGLSFALQPGAKTRVAVWTGTPPGAEEKSKPFDAAWADADWLWQGRTRELFPTIDHPDAMEALRAQTAWLLSGSGCSDVKKSPELAWMCVAALYRAGQSDAARAWVRGFANGVNATGCPPASVSADGSFSPGDEESNGAPEGQFAFMLLEDFRFTQDIPFLSEMYPSLRRCLVHLQALRLREKEHIDAEKRRSRRERTSSGGSPSAGAAAALPEGLLPPDAEGVHRYADLFWALQAWREGRTAASALGLTDDAAWMDEEYRLLRDAIRLSLRDTIDQLPSPFIPDSPERPVLSVQAAALLVWPCTEPGLAEDYELQSTFDAFYDSFLNRFDSSSSLTIPADEPLLLLPLARLGRGDYARELLSMRLSLRHPDGWQTWPDRVARPIRQKSIVGAMPSARAAAAYLLGVRALILDERGQRLHLLQGTPWEWLQFGEGLRADHLPTVFGPLSLRATWHEDHFSVELSGNTRPPEGYRIHWPMNVRPDRVTANGETWTDFDTRGCSLPHDFRGRLDVFLPSSAPWPREP